MKRKISILGVLFLVLTVCLTPAFAAKPATDKDNDGYTSDVDCDDNNPAINPGAIEICDNGIDDNCDGLIDCADGSCSGSSACSDPHAALDWFEYPANCQNCHIDAFNEMSQSLHYTWEGASPDMVNQPEIDQGKLTNAVNSYCINILGDWPVCGSCHAGRGLRPDDSQAGLDNIDCLVCHNKQYAVDRVRLTDGTMGPAIGTAQAVLDGYVRDVHLPERQNCLKCHANAGGGDGVKRGDLAMSLITNTDSSIDVHMDMSNSDLRCQSCHAFINHKVTGKGSDLRATDFASEVFCTTCHPGMDSGTGHSDAGANRTDADRHVGHVSCQACHIDLFAKAAPTEMHRDWRFHHDGSPADGVSGPGHPYIDTLANQPPEFRFWNRLSDNYLLEDAAFIDPETGLYPTSRPLGDIDDGKLYPFKYKTADQPMVTADNVMIAVDTFEFIKASGDIDQSVEQGLVNMGYPASEPYEWITTDTFQLLNHGVAPAADVDCSRCHTGNFDVDSDSMLDKLGYKLKGPKEEVCDQCHDGSKTLPRTHERMHNHITKGSGIDCYFCHTFSRPERNLVSPCDPEEVEFVDNFPYPHECN